MKTYNKTKQELRTRKALYSILPIVGNTVDAMLEPFVGKKICKVDGSFVKKANKLETLQKLIEKVKPMVRDEKNHIYLNRITLNKRQWSGSIELEIVATYAEKDCYGGGHSCAYVTLSFVVGFVADDYQTLDRVCDYVKIPELPSVEEIELIQSNISKLKNELETEQRKLPYWAK